MSTTALIPAFSVMATAGVMLVMPDIALAQTTGGRGGNNNLGSGGASSETGVGGDGAGNANSGGGGGAGVTGGKGGNGGGAGGASAGANGSAGGAAGSGGGGGAHGYFGATVLGTAAIGGSGGAGAASESGATKGGGGGGAGGFGAVITGIGNLGTLNVNVSGGTGGLGGTGSFGGYGGSGGVGLALIGNAANLTINRSVIGGNGGSGGAAVGGLGAAGVAGNGGVGLHVLGANSIVTIGASATVTGGNSGPALNGAGQSDGGIGITGSNLTLIVGGFVSGGTGAFGRARAVSFTGGTNVLELQTGATFIGDVVANSAADTLRLGGATDWIFNASLIGSSSQFRNFGVFEKVGAGTTTLTGSTSAATPWAINGGTLSIGSDGALGGSGPISFNGGTLAVTAGFTSARAITLNAGGGTISTATGATYAVSGILSGAGSLTKSGAGTLELSGENAIGSINLAGGTLRLANNSAAGGAGGIIRTTGSVIDFATGINSPTPIELNSNTTQLQVTSGSATQSGVISEIGGARPIEKIGAGALTLTGDNTYSGGTVISGGTLRIGADSNLGAASGGITINNNAGLTFTSALTINRAITVSGLAAINSNPDVTLTGVISGTGTLSRFSGGTLTLTNTNDYSGGTTIGSSTLQIGDGGTTGTLGAGTVTLNGANLIFNRSDDITVTNDITSTGTVIKRGGGTVTLTGGKSYSHTTVEAGTLSLRGTAGLTGGGQLQMLGGTLDMGVDGAISSATHNSGTLALGGKTLSVITGNYALQSGSITGGGVVALLGNSRNFNIGSTTASIAADVTIRSVGTNNAVFITSPGGNYTLASNLDGSGGLGAAGSMSVLINNLNFTTTLSGNNNYRLGTTVNSGTIAVGSDTALGTGTLFLNPNTALTSVGLRSIANPINLVAGSIAIRNTDTSNTFTLGGVITGSSGFTKTGAGTLILSGANTYTGATTVSEGTLAVANASALGTAAVGTTVESGATLHLQGVSTTEAVTLNGGGLTFQSPNNSIGGLTLGANSAIFSGDSSANVALNVNGLISLDSNTLTVNGRGRVSLNGNVSGSGGLTISTNALIAFDLSGNNTFTGELRIDRGSVLLNGGSSVGDTTAVTVNTPIGELLVNANETIGSLAGSSSSAKVSRTVAGDGVLTIGGSDASTTFAGLIEHRGTFGRLGITKIGTGTLTLTNNNNYRGDTTISAGTLEIGNGGTTGFFGVGNIINNATLAINRNNFMGIGNVISGTGALNLNGTGVILLGAANTYSGLTSLNNGSLIIENNTALGTTAAGTVVADGTSLAVQGGLTGVAEAITLNGVGVASSGALRNLSGDNVLTGAITLGSAVRINSDANLLDLRGGISGTNTNLTFGGNGSISAGGNIAIGTGLLTKEGTGILTLGGTNTIGNITVAGGALRLSSSGAAGGAGGQITTTGSVIDYANGITTATPITINSNTTQLQVTTGAATQSGAISEAGGARPLEKIGAGELNLTGINTYSGGTTISAGTLSVFADTGLGAASGGVTISNARLQLNNADTSTRAINLMGSAAIDATAGASWTLGGGISGTGSLTKGGAGILVLSGNNTYAGTTTITDGSLRIGAGGTTGTLGVGAVTNNASLVFNRSNDFTVANLISGTGSVTKLGAGVLTLSAINAYAGGTTISAGTLQLGIGVQPASLGSGPVSIATGASLRFDGSGTRTINGAISGGGSVTVGGNATVRLLSTTGSYTGGTIVNSGSLGLSGATSAGTGLITMNGGTLRALASLTLTNELTIPTGAEVSLEAASGQTLTLSNQPLQNGLNLNGTLRINGGTVQFSATNATFAENSQLFISSGTLRNTPSSILPTLLNTISQTRLIFGTLDLGGQSGVGIRNLQGVGTLINDGATTIIRGGDFSGSITGTQNIISTGALTLSGANNFSGTTLVQSGTLTITQETNALGSAVGGTIVQNGATLATSRQQGGISIQDAITVGGTGNGGIGALRASAGAATTFSNSVSLTADTLFTAEIGGFVFSQASTLAGNGFALTLGGNGGTSVLGNWTNLSSLTKNGLGTLNFSGNNTFTGPVFLNEGGISLQGGSALADTVALTIGSTASLSTVGLETIGSLAGSGQVFLTAALNVPGTLSIGANNTATEYSGRISSFGALTKVGTSTLTLSGDNSWEGVTTISAGTLQIGNGGTTGTLGTGNVVNNASLVFNRSNDLTVANLMSGGGSLTKQGAGTLILAGNNSYSGGTTISGGTLQLGSGSATPGTVGSGPVSIASGAILRFDGAGDKIVAGAISGGGSVIVGGSGTATLNSATGSYTGGTTVNSGTLALAGASSAGTGIITMNGGALQADASFTLTNRLRVSQGADVRIVTAPGVTLTKTGDQTNPLDLIGTLRIATTGTGANAGTFRFSSAATTTESARLIIESGTLLNTTSSVFPAVLNVIDLTQIDSAGTLNLGGITFGGADGIKNLRGSGTLINNGSTTVILSGSFSGNISGTQNIISTGVLELSGASTFSGTASVQSGTLTISSSGGLGTSAGGTTVRSGATLALAGAGGLGDAITFGGTGVGGLGALRALSGTQTLSGNITLMEHSLISAASGATLTFQPSLLQGNAQRLTFDNAGTITANTSITNVESLTKNGSGLLTLGGTNTSIGSVVVNAGTLRTQNGGAIADNAAVTVNAGATLDIDSVAPEGIGSLAGSGFITVSNATSSLAVLGSSTTTFSGQISGVGGLNKSGTGTLTLTGTNSYARITDIFGGTLVVQGGAALPDAALLFIGAGATLRVEAGETIGGFGGAGNIVLATTGPLIAQTTDVQGLSGVISQSGAIGSFTKRGIGQQILSGANTFTGLTSVEAGILTLSGAGALASTTISTSAGATLRSDGGAFASSAVISHAGTLALTGSETIGSISGAGAITLTGATLTTGNADDATLSGIIGGTGALAKTGSGTLTLSGANTYQGGTTVSAGTLVLGQVAGGNIGAAGTGTITFANNAVLQSSVTGILANSLAINSGVSATIGAAGGTTLTLTGNSFVNLGGAGSTLTFGSSTMTGQVTLDFAGAPTTNVAGAGAIAGGTVQVNSLLAGSFFGALQAGMTVGTGATSATLNLNGINLDLFNLAGSASGIITNQGAQAARARVASLVNSTYAGVLTNGAFALNLVKSLSGTLTLTGDNSYTGTTTIDGGTLQIGAGGTSGSLGTGAVTNNGSLVFNRSDTLVVSSAISGTGVLTQSGPGITALTGANNYSGATTISAGTLQIGNGGTTGSLGSGAVTNNATLAINLSSDITLAQAITGTGALRKLGTGGATITSNLALGSATVEAGMLALSGSNSFTNGITVAGGTLALRSTNAAGGAAGIIRTTGSVIDYSDGLIMVTPIQLNSNTTQLQVLTGSATQSGVISEIGGARPLEKIGAGTLTLAGVNSYSGGTVITAGRLNVASSSNLGNAAGGLTIGNAVLGITATFGSGRAVSLTGAAGMDVALGASLIQSGLVSGLGGLTKTGAGTLFLTANNSYAGTTTVSAGDIIVGGGSTTGSLGAGNVVVNGGSALQFNRSDAFTVANIISGAGLVAKQGNGVMTLTGANTFSSALAIAGGTVVLDHATGGVIDAAGTGFIQLLSNTTLRSAVSGTLSNSLSLRNANVTVAAATGTTVRLASNQLSFDGPAGSSLNFGTATATGTVDLAPALVSLGTPVNPINVNGGTLRLSNANAFTLLNGSSTVTLNGATLGADVAGSLARLFLVESAGGTIDVATSLLTLQSETRFTGGLTKTGTGELRLTGPVTGAGTVQVNAGTLALVGNTGGWGSGTLQMAAGTNLLVDIPLGTTYANNIVLGAGAGSTILSRNTTISGTVSGGPLNVGALAGSNFLVLSGNNAYSATNIAAGARLQIGVGGTTGTLGTGAVTVGTGSVLSFVRSDNQTVGNIISGAGSIQKFFGNTLTLTGNNTAADAYTGTASITAGTLLVNGNLGDVTNRAARVIALSGATLGGNGTIFGTVFVNSGGILSPGNSAGTLTVAGNLSLGASSILNFELGEAGVVGGASNDLVNVGGNLVLDGTLNVTALPGFGAGFYRLFNYGGTLTNNQLVSGTVPGGFTSSIITDIAGQVNVLFNAGALTEQYWDGADLTGATATLNGDGGAGTWSGTTANWTSANSFAVNANWLGQAGIFAGAAGGIVSVTGTQAFQQLRFLTDGYTLNPIGPTGGLATTGGFSIINVDTGVSTRLNTPISGVAGLTKTGAGTLTLAGANSYGGLTTVASGTLSLLSGGVIAGAVQNNATLTNGGTIAGLVTNAGTLTSTGTFGGGLVNNAGAVASLSGSIDGTINNSGTITLSSGINSTAALVLNSTGILNLSSTFSSFGSLAGIGTINSGTGGSLTVGSDNSSTTFSGRMLGGSQLVKTGAGTLTFTNATIDTTSLDINQGTAVITNGFATPFGPTVVSNRANLGFSGSYAGTIVNTGNLVFDGTVGSLSNLLGGIAQISGLVTLNLNNSANLNLTGNTSVVSRLTINGNSTTNVGAFDLSVGSVGGLVGTLTINGGRFTVGGVDQTSTLGSVITGNGELRKIGSTLLTLSGANSFNGMTTVAGGSLELTGTGSLASAVQNNAVLRNSGSISGLVTNAGTLNSDGRLFGGLANDAGATATLSGTLNGPVTNAGSITLAGTTTGSATLSQTAGGALNLAGFNATIRSLEGSGAVQLGSGTLSLSGNGISTSFNGAISGSGNLTKLGTGTLTLSGANSFAGLATINLGAIALTSTGSLAGAVQNNASLVNAGVVSGVVTNAANLVSSGTLAGGLVNNAGASASIANVVGGAVTNSGTITLAGAVTGIDTLNQNSGGIFNLAGFSASLGSMSGTGDLQLGGGTLTTGSNGASTSFDGVISGSGTLNKAGTGTLTLGGSNTAGANFTGNVSVNSGSLQINGQFGDTVASAATLTVANGATLGGSGNFLGNIALGAGSILAPGNSPGTLAIAGNLLLDSTSMLNFELAQAGVVGGGINDLITVGGNLTLDGTLNVTSLPGFGAGIYRLFNYGGTLTDNGLALGTLPGGFTTSLITGVAGQISIQFSLGVPTILYWDGADIAGASVAATGNGGAGTWNSATTNWTSAPGFNANFAWGSQTGVFAGAVGGAVSIDGTQAFQQLRFETGGYTLSAAAGGGGLATTGGLSIVDVSAGIGATINAPIQGNAGLTKAGTGTLTLGGVNSYTGLTGIAAGTLAVSAGGSLAGAVENNATFTNNGTVQGLVTNAGTLRSVGTLSAGLSNNAGAVADVSGVWNGAVSNAGTVRLVGVTSGNVTFNQLGTGVFDLAGSTASIGALSGSGSVQLGTGTLFLGRSNDSTSFAGVISGSGSIEKQGTGTFTLTGANTFTGRTLVSAGTLALASGASLVGPVTNTATFTNAGTVAANVINSGTFVSTGVLNGGLTNNAGATASLAGVAAGNLINRGVVNLTGTTTGIAELTMATGSTFNLGGFATTFGNLTGGGGTVALGSATLTLGSGTGSQTFDGTITGTGGLTKVSASTFSLSGAQGYTGLTSINGGTFILGSNASLAGALANNAIVSSNGRIAGLVTNNATLTSTGALDGGLVNTAGALARLQGTLAGAVTNAATITLIGATSGIGAVTQASTGSFVLGPISTSFGSLAGSGTVTLANGAVLTTGGNNASTSFGGAITGAGGLTKTGTGTFTLTGASNYAGLTTVAAGALNIQTNAALGTVDGGTIVNAGAALELQGGITVTGEALTINGSGIADGGALRHISGNSVWAGTVTLGSDARIVALAGRVDIEQLAGTTQNLIVAGAGLTGISTAISTGTLTVAEGSTALFGNGNFAAGVTVNGGALFLQGGSSIDDSAAVTVNGGGLIIGVSETIGALAGSGGTVQLDAGQTLTLGGNNGSTSYSGLVFNTGNLVKQGTGTFTVTGALAHTGTTSINGGTLLSGAANVWQGNGLVTINAGGTLDLGGFDQSIATITLTGGRLANGVLAGAITSAGGTINGITGTANRLTATAGTTNLTGAGSFAQGVTLSGGDVALLGSGTSIDDSAAVVVNAGTLKVNSSETIGSLAGNGGGVQIAALQTLTTGGTSASTSFAGILSGAGGLTKVGTGTFTLAGANSYTGLTTVGAGILALNAGGTLAGAVQNNAGFSNAGTVAGLVTNAGTLISTGVLGGGLVNSSGAGLAGALNGAVSNSGLIQLQGGLTGIDAFNQTDSGIFDLAGFSTTVGSLAGTGNVVLGNATLTTGGNNGSTSFAGLISGTGGLTKTGSGTFTLTTGQSFTGLTTVSGGALAITGTGGLAGSVLNNASFSSVGTITGGLTNNGAAQLAGLIGGAVANNGSITSTGTTLIAGRLSQAATATFSLAGFSNALGSLTGAGRIDLGSGNLTVGGDGTSSSFAGVISGSGGLFKIGTGTFTLSGVNSYSGTTVVNAGTLVIGDGTTPAAAVTTSNAVASIGVAMAAQDAAIVAISAPIAEQPVSQPASPVAAPLAAGGALAAINQQLPGANTMLDGGRTTAGLTSSASRVDLSGALQSGPERVDLFADVAVEALPVTQAVSPIARLGTASLDGGLAAVTLDSAVASVAPAASADNVAQAGALSAAVIAGNVVNFATVINNGTIGGQLSNAVGAITTNNGVITGTVFNDGIFSSVGTLSGGLSNNGTARIQGVLTGDVFNAGTLTLTGTTSGIAVFQQAATGNLNLAGFDTTLGTLSGAGTITLGSARLATGTNGVASLFSGVIAGTGGLTKTGTGGLILTGENLYTGGTTIAAGALQLGDGGTSGSILGPITNNGTLIVNRSNAYTLASVISGTGMVVQSGTGVTTLTGANSYSGGTLISAGRLIGSTASLQGLIQNDAALEFAQATNGVFTGRIGGSGIFDKTGAGLLELTGDNSALRGATAVRSGELRVSGSLAGSATSVLSGATLSGTGTVGGLIARSGATVSPGANGLGMLGVNGAIQLQSGSTLRLQIQAASGSDMLVGNASMQIAGTAALTNLGGTYAFNSNYLLLQASGGRTGTFENVTGFADFGILYRPELVYTGTQVLLRMAPNLLTNIAGSTQLTGNQRSVVSRIDAAVTAGYNPQPLFNVYSLPTAQLAGAFDQLSGEIYATAAGVGIEQERLVREAVLGRIGAVASASRQTPEHGTGAGAWAQVFGSWGDGKGDGNASRFENDRQGFITGIDHGSANSDGSWRMGAFGFNTTSKVSVDRIGSRAEVEQTGGGIYAGVNSGAFSVATGVAVAGVDLATVRTISLPGFAETNRGRGDGKAVQGFAELSYSIEAGQATYRPFVSVAAGSFKLDGQTETGGAAALVVRRQSYASGSITAGVDGTLRMGAVQLSGTLAGRAQMGDRDPQAQVALAAAPAQAFGVRGVQLDSVALAARLDALVSLGKNADLSLGYTGLVGKDTADHGARATLSVRF